MARDKGAERIGLALFFAGIIGLVFMTVAPIFLVGGWLYLRYRLFGERISIFNPAGVNLNKEELLDLKLKYEQCIDLSESVEELKEKGHQAGISINKDGTFSARSKLGKQIQQNIDIASETLETAADETHYLANRPSYEWDYFSTLYKKEKSFFIALLAFLGCGLYLGHREYTGIFDPFIIYFKLLPNYIKDQPLFLDTCLTMAGISVSAFIISYLFFSILFYFWSPVKEITYDDLRELSKSEHEQTTSLSQTPKKTSPNGNTSITFSENRKQIIDIMKLFFKLRQGSGFKESHLAADLWCKEKVKLKREEYTDHYENEIKGNSEIVYGVEGLHYDVVNLEGTNAVVRVSGEVDCIIDGKKYLKEFPPCEYVLHNQDGWKIFNIK